MTEFKVKTQSNKYITLEKVIELNNHEMFRDIMVETLKINRITGKIKKQEVETRRLPLDAPRCRCFIVPMDEKTTTCSGVSGGISSISGDE